MLLAWIRQYFDKIMNDFSVGMRAVLPNQTEAPAAALDLSNTSGTASEREGMVSHNMCKMAPKAFPRVWQFCFVCLQRVISEISYSIFSIICIR